MQRMLTEEICVPNANESESNKAQLQSNSISKYKDDLRQKLEQFTNNEILRSQYKCNEIDRKEIERQEL